MIARTVFVTLCLAMLSWAQARDAGRTKPPQVVTCDRDRLTSYNGVVRELERKPGFDRIVIATDRETIEEVTVVHGTPHESGLPYLVSGEPMKIDDWQHIVRWSGLLKPGVRAIAWVCDDPAHGIIVEWLPADGRP